MPSEHDQPDVPSPLEQLSEVPAAAALQPPPLQPSPVQFAGSIRPKVMLGAFCVSTLVVSISALDVSLNDQQASAVAGIFAVLVFICGLLGLINVAAPLLAEITRLVKQAIAFFSSSHVRTAVGCLLILVVSAGSIECGPLAIMTVTCDSPYSLHYPRWYGENQDEELQGHTSKTLWYPGGESMWLQEARCLTEGHQVIPERRGPRKFACPATVAGGALEHMEDIVDATEVGERLPASVSRLLRLTFGPAPVESDYTDVATTIGTDLRCDVLPPFNSQVRCDPIPSIDPLAKHQRRLTIPIDVIRGLNGHPVEYRVTYVDAFTGPDQNYIWKRMPVDTKTYSVSISFPPTHPWKTMRIDIVDEVRLERSTVFDGPNDTSLPRFTWSRKDLKRAQRVECRWTM